MDRERRTSRYEPSESMHKSKPISEAQPPQTDPSAAKQKASPRKTQTTSSAYSRPANPSAVPQEQIKPNPCLSRSQGFHPNDVSMDDPVRKACLRRRLWYSAAIIALLAVFIFSAYQLIHYLILSGQAKQEEQMVKAIIADSETAVIPEMADTPSPAPAAQADPVEIWEPEEDFAEDEGHTLIEVTRPEILVQFNQALAINPDTVGQLQMGDSISTYVVQRDNAYYLRHSFTGDYSFSGAIFMDVSCSIYPQSRMLIIHGHNMQDGTAFGKLSRYDDVDYLTRYPYIRFSTLYDAARYVPFAVVYYSIDEESDAYLDVYQVNTMSDQAFGEFISKIQYMSVYHIPVLVAKTDQIIMVTTCTSGNNDMRFAVFGVRQDSI